jgi:hypothetical protein
MVAGVHQKGERNFEGFSHLVRIQTQRERRCDKADHGNDAKA